MEITLSKLTETQDVLLDAIKSTTQDIVKQYTSSHRLAALKTLAQSYSYVAGIIQATDEPEPVKS